MTSGPSLPSSMSTPATRRPMICAERTAACSYSGVSSTASTVPPRWTLERNSSPLARRRMAATTRSPTTSARMSRPRLSVTKLWMSTFCFVLCSVSMIASAILMSGREDDADALRALEQLDDDGRPADALDGGHDVGAVAHERRCRHADVVAREDLRGAELVAGVGDAVRGVRRVDVHLLELAHDGRAEVGDRVADARQHRVVVGDRPPAELQVRLGPGEVDGEAERVEHPHLVPAVERCGAQALRGVGTWRAREDREFHAGSCQDGRVSGPAYSSTPVGWREWVGLPGIGLPWLKAKIDTGARTSSLHADDVEEFDRDGEPWVRFTVHPWQDAADDAGRHRVPGPRPSQRAQLVGTRDRAARRAPRPRARGPHRPRRGHAEQA